ncbi:MAG: hypothetical protein ACLQLT_06770 [Methylovirgula sp.]
MMMAWDEDDRPRRPNEAAEWTWYSVERSEPTADPGVPTLAHHVGNRLRIIYPVAQIPEEPAAFWRLIEELAAKDI